jgi:hypothetical protein
MATQQAQTRPAEVVRKVAEHALSDAIEIKQLIALMEQQNVEGVNKLLSERGAGRAAICVRNALVARLVTLICQSLCGAEKRRFTSACCGLLAS